MPLTLEGDPFRLIEGFAMGIDAIERLPIDIQPRQHEVAMPDLLLDDAAEPRQVIHRAHSGRGSGQW